MQYLLTEIEYTDLKNKDAILADQAKKDLQEVCTYAANEVPINYWGRTDKSPWGCILTTLNEHYCDHCPVENQCQYDDKQWSK